MNTRLPENNFFNDFYFWFDKKNKQEYYTTPLYFYKVSQLTNIETKIGDYILSLVDDKVEVEKPTIQPEPVVEDNNSGYKYRTETF